MLKVNTELMSDAVISLKGSWGKAVLIIFIYFFLMAFKEITSEFLLPIGQFQETVIDILYTIFVGAPLTFGLATFYLALSRKASPPVEQLFHGYKRLLGVNILYFLRLLFIALWTLLLIVPGIIACISYALSSYLFIDNPNMSAREAITLSKKMMNGNKKKLFFLWLRYVPWFLLAILTVGIGLLWVCPYYYTGIAKFYDDVRANYVENTETSEAAPKAPDGTLA